jgi:hypothetical protein
MRERGKNKGDEPECANKEEGTYKKVEYGLI